jgi:disulfide bond formation protein DsbB
MLHKNFVALFTVIFSLTSLSFGYILEYGFDILPCHLCIWQRVIYYVMTLTGFLMLWQKKYHKSLLIILSLIVIGGIFLSIFQVGVEKGIFSLPSSCQSDFSNASNIEALKIMIMEDKPRCDIVNFKIFGLSLASVNIIWLLLFTAIIGYLNVCKKN